MPGETRILLYVALAVVIAGMMALRLRRMSRAQPLKLERLWIVPALLVVGLVFMLAQAPPQGLAWLFMAGALVVGGGFGWVRGSTMAIAVDPQTHALNVKASPWAIALLAGLIVVRYGMRSVLAENAGSLHLSVTMITDISLAFAVGLLGVQRVEMALRARRLLAAARAAALPPS